MIKFKNIFRAYLLLTPIFLLAQKGDSLIEKPHFYLGVNPVRMPFGDFELNGVFDFGNHICIGASGGYDFNFLDLDHSVVTKTKKMESVEQQRQINGIRYIWGQGPVLRTSLEFNLGRPQKKRWFLSIEWLIKIRNYTNHGFDRYPLILQENGQQTIHGISLYAGFNNEVAKHFTLRFYWGLGVRYIKSNIARPGYFYDVSYWPEENFTVTNSHPSLHIGLILFWKN